MDQNYRGQTGSIEDLEVNDIERMKKFINKWKKEDIRYALSVIDLGIDDYMIEVPELRRLTMAAEEDEWFVQHSI